MRILILCLLLACVGGCGPGGTVTITKEYVINPNWNKLSNSFTVYKMTIKDSVNKIDIINPTEQELYYGLIKDVNASYISNVTYNGESYSKRKVYFNKDNGLSWKKMSEIHGSTEYRTIGELKQDTWYLFDGLSQFRSLYYVYVDAADSLHVFKVSTMTNV